MRRWRLIPIGLSTLSTTCRHKDAELEERAEMVAVLKQQRLEL
jgi:hypothetical protein